MGRPIAQRVLEAGFKVAVYDRDSSKAEELINYGGTPTESVAALSYTSDVLLSCLPHDEGELDVYAGSDGAFANSRPGALVICIRPVYPATSHELARLGSERCDYDLRVT